MAVLGPLPVPNRPYGLCGRKATLGEENRTTDRYFVLTIVLSSQYDCTVVRYLKAVLLPLQSDVS